MAEEDRARKYRFAGLIMPLLAAGCGAIALLTLLGFADLVYFSAHRQPDLRRLNASRCSG